MREVALALWPDRWFGSGIVRFDPDNEEHPIPPDVEFPKYTREEIEKINNEPLKQRLRSAATS